MAVSEKSINDKIETTSILEEIEKERKGNGLLQPTKYSHKEDLENLLKLAEELDEKCSKTRSRIRIYRFIQILGVLLLLIWTVYSTFYSPLDTKAVIFVGIIVSLINILFYQVAFINSLKKQLSSDKRALTEVLQLLRETSNSIAEQEDWSVLSRAEFRIRLSRFDLGKYEPSFNFFSYLFDR